MPAIVTAQDIVLRLACALLAGAAIGLNRETKGQAAGLRTTVLVCLAAALAGLEANLLLGTHRPEGVEYTSFDVLRLPLGLLSGVGFLGAGAIVRRGDMVRGVTTAATIWFISVAGLCIGVGQTGLGLGATAVALLVLWLMKQVDRALPHAIQFALSVTATREGPGEAEVRERLTAAGYRWIACRLADEEGGRRYTLDAVLERRVRGETPMDAPDVFKVLARAPGVERAEWRTLMLKSVQEPPIRGSGAHEEDGLPVPRRYWSVLTIWLAMSMTVLDGSIANVALPTIAHELRANAASSIWIVNAYQLAITISLLPLAALGDLVGYRKVYMAGLALFTLGSLFCALSRTLPELAAARFFQGFGAAGVMSINAALVRFTYPRRYLGRGIGLNAVIISISAAVGPTVASAILGAASWQWLFAVNVPIGVAAIAIAICALPRAVGSGRGFDWLSAVLNAAAFGFLILGAESVVRVGPLAGLGELAAGAVAAVFLVARELKRPEPLVPFDLLRIPIFGLSIATSIVSFAAQMLAYVALPFYLQGHMGRGVVTTGLLLTPWPLAVGVSAPIAGRLADRYPAGLLGGIGLAVFACGLAALALLDPHAGDLDIVWRTALCGAGFGFFQSPNNRAMVASAPAPRSGAAGGMLATARLLGQTAGALTVAIFFHLAGTGATVAALGSASAVAAVAALVSLSRLKFAPRPATRREAAAGR